MEIGPKDKALPKSCTFGASSHRSQNIEYIVSDPEGLHCKGLNVFRMYILVFEANRDVVDLLQITAYHLLYMKC